MTAPAPAQPAGGTGAARESRLAGVVLLPIALVVWHLAAQFDLASDRLLPAPIEVGRALAELVRRGYFYDNLWVTIRVVAIGMAFSLAIGIGLAAILGMFPLLRDGVYPYIVVLNVVPKVALVPLLTVALGFSAQSRTIIVVLVAFFPVFLNTLSAVGNPRADRDRLMRSLGASRWQRLRMHRLPEGAPAIFAGVKLSLTIAFIATVLAEFLIRRDGLAYLITTFGITLNTPMMYAVTIAVGAIGTAFYFIADRLERRLVFWEQPHESTGTGK